MTNLLKNKNNFGDILEPTQNNNRAVVPDLY
jgi:hypothetical protein